MVCNLFFNSLFEHKKSNNFNNLRITWRKKKGGSYKFLHVEKYPVKNDPKNYFNVKNIIPLIYSKNDHTNYYM